MIIKQLGRWVFGGRGAARRSSAMVKAFGRTRPGVPAIARRRAPRALARSRASDVEVRTSTVPAAGKGLFAVRDFPKGTLLPAPYKGKRLTLEQFKRLRDFRWCFEVKEGKTWAVDGKALKRGNPLRWVNGARTPAQRRQVNVAGLKLEDGEAWYATTRPVKAGSEFWIDYGPGYWQAGLPLAPTSGFSLESVRG